MEIQAHTRREEFPIGKTTYVQGTSAETLHIRQGGTENAWHLLTLEAGTKFVSDLFNTSDYNIVVEAEYVIIRGLELKNAAIDGILIRSGIQNVVLFSQVESVFTTPRQCVSH